MIDPMTQDDPGQATIPELFARQVQRCPGATALRFLGAGMSYAELDERADALAHTLQSLGVADESIVGVCMERSLEMAVALLGILKAGGAYLPIHPKVAYVVADGSDAAATVRKLRVALHTRLSRHMVPPVIAVLESLPLTRNDKVDRAALPRPERSPRDTETDYEAPRGPLEALLADLWADALAVQKVGIHDDFFELGGNSLIAADLLASIQSVVGSQPPSARLFFANPTVAGLAALASTNGADTRPETRQSNQEQDL